MSWLVDTRALARARQGLVGPGRLVLVVGPSGAGKDTLLRGAQAACAGDASVVFPRRVVTRPKSEAEDHDTLTETEFTQAVADGAFALWWGAHGNQYGIPSSIDADIRNGRTVVCNVSRTMTGATRRKYADVAVVLVTAPEKILAARLRQRQRADDGDLAKRVQRSTDIRSDYEADFVIHNTSRPEVGIRRLLNAIRDPGFYVIY